MAFEFKMECDCGGRNGGHLFTCASVVQRPSLLDKALRRPQYPPKHPAFLDWHHVECAIRVGKQCSCATIPHPSRYHSCAFSLRSDCQGCIDHSAASLAELRGHRRWWEYREEAWRVLEGVERYLSTPFNPLEHEQTK